MTYLDFTLELLEQEFGIHGRDQPIFPTLGEIVPSARLQDSLSIAEDVAVVSEKARCEFIVTPFLIECRERMQRRINIFSGVRLDGDVERGLKGECDFILARSTTRYALQKPIMVILEAKKHDIDEGIGQCAAQLLGAHRFNERGGSPVSCVYGCVTNGEVWQFLKLQGSELLIHRPRINITEPGKILWLFMQSLHDVNQQASDAA